MSLWQLGASVDGWLNAHVPSDERSMSVSEADELWAWMQAKEGRMQ